MIWRRGLYENRYGSPYYSFDYNGNRFQFLDGNEDHWNISGDQLEFFHNGIRNMDPPGNLFIFWHQILWWRWDKELKLNSYEEYEAFPNYWTEGHPRLDSLDVPVYVFAGDVGAGDWSSNFMYDKLDNVRLLARGMGKTRAIIILKCL